LYAIKMPEILCMNSDAFRKASDSSKAGQYSELASN
jgi:hypothetical protein